MVDYVNVDDTIWYEGVAQKVIRKLIKHEVETEIEVAKVEWRRRHLKAVLEQKMKRSKMMPTEAEASSKLEL